MILSLDEVVNISPVNTLYVNGLILNYQTLAGTISNNGPMAIFHPGTNPVCMPGATLQIVPFGGTASGIGQAVGAWPGSASIDSPPPDGLWNIAGNGVSAQAWCPYALYPGIPPFVPQGLSVLVVPPKGPTTVIFISLVRFDAVVTQPSQFTWAADAAATTYFSCSQDPETSGNIALVTAVGTMPEGTTQLRGSFGFETANQHFDLLQPETWTQQGGTLTAVRTVVLPGSYPSVVVDDNGQWVPPPILKFGLYVGDAPYFRSHGLVDYSNAVATFQQNQARADSSLFISMREIVDISLTVGGFFAPDPLAGIAMYGFQTAIDGLPLPGQ